MAKKTNKITIPKEVSTLSSQPTTEPLDPTLEKLVSSPMTGSPTTGNSGLVNKRVSKITKERRPQQKSKAVSNELRISQKRKLATDLSRTILRQEPLLNKVLRLFADKNVLVNPTEQKLVYGIKSDQLNTYIQINLKLLNKLSTNIISEINKTFKDVKVSNDSDPNNTDWLNVTLSISKQVKQPKK